jgi:hypothetical protein
MSDTSFLQRRKKPPTAEEAAAAMQHIPAIRDPRVQQFVSDFISTQDQMRDQAQHLRQLELECDKLTGRCDWQEKELDRMMRSHADTVKRIMRSKDGFARGFHAQQAEIAVLVTAAEAAKENALVAAETAYRTSTTAIKTAFDGFSEAVNAAMREISRSVVEETGESLTQRPAIVDADTLLSEDNANKQIAAHFGANNRRPEQDEEVK